MLLKSQEPVSKSKACVAKCDRPGTVVCVLTAALFSNEHTAGDVVVKAVVLVLVFISPGSRGAGPGSGVQCLAACFDVVMLELLS